MSSLSWKQLYPSQYLLPIMSSACFKRSANISFSSVEYMSRASSRGTFCSEGRPSYCSGDTIIPIFVVLHFSSPSNVGTESHRFLSRTPDASEFLPSRDDWVGVESERDKGWKR